MVSRKSQLPALGWREWVALPELGIPAIKVKVDTGARSSALHAFDVEAFRRRGKDWLRFAIHPLQRDSKIERLAEAELLDRRSVRSSSGHVQTRWFIQTGLEIAGESWPIELTLTSRDEMGFRMLLGREAIRRRFLVDPGRSFCSGRMTKAEVLKAYRMMKAKKRS